MKPTLRIITLALALAAAALTFAQGRGGGGGMFMRGPGGGAGSPTMLLQRDDVQKEIKLSADQKKKLDDLNQAMRDKFQEMRQNGGQGGDRQAMMAEFQKMRDEQEKQVNAVLTADQQKRLKELWIQRSGAMVITNEDVQKQLGFTDDQKSKVKDLMQVSQEANQALREKMQNQEIDRQEFQASMQKNNDLLKEKLQGVLTTDQAAKLKAMGGAPFKFDEDNNGG